LYSYLYGFMAFGEVENNLYDRAMKNAELGLELNRHDAWSTHAKAHVLEMAADPRGGIKFISTTLNDWVQCGMLACHNFWHWALYHIELGEYEAALDIYDNEIIRRAHSSAMLDIVDTTSLLYRLELEGVDVGKRWEEAYQICLPHLKDHITTFNDIHLLFSCVGMKDQGIVVEYFSSFSANTRSGKGDQTSISRDIGMILFQAVMCYNNGQYDEVAALLYPIRYSIVEIGGSDAQRDIFSLLLIASLLKCKNSNHCRMIRGILSERQGMRENSPMTKRLIERAVELHKSN